MTRASALQQWKQARFGLMVHFGLYSLPGGVWKGQEMDYIGEWLQARFRVPMAEYERLAAEFNPLAFDADAWVMLAKQAGMRYLLVTAKHHDGFALFHSQVDRFNVVDATPFGRDILAELSAACAQHGLHFALYYSQTLDWREPNAGGANANGLNKGMSWFNNWDFRESGRDFSEYFERKALPQITELLTNYGPIFAMWFDTPLDMDRSFSRRIYERVKELQPDCLVNSRLGSGFHDYESTGDNMIPPGKARVLLEAPATLNDTWGFKVNDQNWKSSGEVIRTLTTLASHDVNYLLNVGPDGTGAFPARAQTILGEVGEWMKGNGDSLLGAGPSPFDAEPGWAAVTIRDNHLYLRLEPEVAGLRFLSGIQSRVISARLSRDSSVKVPFLQAGESLSLTLPAGHSLDVVEVETEGHVRVRPGLYAHGGLLQLDVGQGEFTGEWVSAKPSTRKVDADGESHDDSVPSVRRGTTFGWKSSAVQMQWPVWFQEAGRYQVAVETSVAYHGQPWTGGHRLRVRVGSTSLSALLQPQHLEKKASENYQTVLCDLGTLEIVQAGDSLVCLEVPEWQPCPTGLHVTRVVMEKQSESS